MKLELSSDAFKEDEKIPKKYTCQGEEISPPLRWVNIPINVRSFAVLMQDLDTPLFPLTHWLIFNIPGNITSLDEGISHNNDLSNEILQGRNSMRKNAYLGPCPPFGKHRYRFKVYALDKVLPNDKKINKKKFLKLTKGHVISKASLTGNYSKE